jgi:hypothetical protein
MKNRQRRGFLAPYIASKEMNKNIGLEMEEFHRTEAGWLQPAYCKHRRSYGSAFGPAFEAWPKEATRGIPTTCTLN